MRVKKRYFLRGFLILLCMAIVVTAGVVAQQYYHSLEERNFTSIEEGVEHSYDVYPGTTIDQMLEMMEKDYVISSRLYFNIQSKLMDFNYPEPGHYTFGAEISDRELIGRLKYGKQTPVTITWNNTIRTREQLAGVVSSKLMMDSVTLLDYMVNDSFLAKYGVDSESSRCLFIPNTYEVYWDTTPEKLFARMKKEFDTFWNEERKAKAEKLGLTPVEVAIIASIIEGESNNQKELPTIASLYLNRVHKNMLLQACPTVIYANGDFTIRRVLKRHLQIDSPYNTYKYRGLPPGPIRCPNPQSIDIVLNAPKTNYLYMCANSALDGTHIFSSDYSIHQRAANQYHDMMDNLQ